MVSVRKDTSIRELQSFIREVYGKPNDLHFDLWHMLTNVERFAMRGLKGIRKRDREKTRKNLLISVSWFISTLNRLHINLEEISWKRFPYLCSYCASSPCECRKEKVENRREVPVDGSRRPENLKSFQKMFSEIYPPEKRTLDHAGVHLAEELGEFSEALLGYRGGHTNTHFEDVKLEAADVFSCFMGVFNSLEIDIARELSEMFRNNCHECSKAPCECTFDSVVKYKS